MGLFSIPDPVSMFESAVNAKLVREEAVALISSTISAYITGLWSSGNAKWAFWTGEAQAMKDAATVIYLTLHQQVISGTPLTLTVPTEMLTADNLSRFQTEFKEKK